MDDNDEIIEDRTLDRAAAMGSRRCRNADRLRAAVTLPAQVDSDWKRRTTERLTKALPPDQLQDHQAELLGRVLAFVRFLEDNLGDSEEFPLALTGESREALQLFRLHFVRMKNVAGLLMDI